MKPHYNTIITIVTCPKNTSKKRALQKTWLRSLPKHYLVLFIYGNDGREVPRLEGNKLYVNAPESWATLPAKIYEMLTYLNAHYSFDKVFKIDDDIFIYDPNFFFSKIPAKDYSGKFFLREESYFKKDNLENYYTMLRDHGCKEPFKPYEHPIPPSFASGGAYCLSKWMVDEICNVKKETIPEYGSDIGFEDVMIANLFYRSNEKSTKKLRKIDWFNKHPYYLLKWETSPCEMKILWFPLIRWPLVFVKKLLFSLKIRW